MLISCLTSHVAVNRAEVVKAGGVQPLVSALDLNDVKAQSSACLALSRVLQEGKFLMNGMYAYRDTIIHFS